MEALRFSRNSWHYHLATEYSSYRAPHEGPNLCGYIRSVVMGSIIALFITAVLATIAVSFESLIIWAIVCVQNGIWFKPGVETLFAFAIIGLALLAGVVILVCMTVFGSLNVLEKRRAAGKPDPFVINAVKSWHNKICKKVDFV